MRGGWENRFNDHGLFLLRLLLGRKHEDGREDQGRNDHQDNHATHCFFTFRFWARLFSIIPRLMHEDFGNRDQAHESYAQTGQSAVFVLVINI